LMPSAAAPSRGGAHHPAYFFSIESFGGADVSTSESETDNDGDDESGRGGAHHAGDSPLRPMIQSKLLDEEVVDTSVNRFWHSCLVLLESITSKRARSFYEQQNELVKELMKVESMHHGVYGAVRDAEADSRLVHFAVKASVVLTVVLIAMKVSTAALSSSVAIVASAVDSGLDLLSQLTLYFTTLSMQKRDLMRYPSGKARMESMGVVIFSVIMGMAAVQLLSSSVMNLLHGGEQVEMSALSITILALVILFQVVGYVVCRAIAVRTGGSAAVTAIADDHLNDVLINIIGGVPAIIAAYYRVLWWFDGAGAIALSIYIAARWSKTCYEEYGAMIGRTAPASFLNTLTYMAASHHPAILKVDYVTAYRIGPRYQVELHIALPADMPLREAHDIGESLEQKVELLEDVEMTFVHLDYEWQHKAEHKVRSLAGPVNPAPALKPNSSSSSSSSVTSAASADTTAAATSSSTSNADIALQIV